MFQDDHVLSERDLSRLCAEINFDEEINEDKSSTTSTTETGSTASTTLGKEALHPDWNVPISSITLGDELDINNIREDNDIADMLKSDSDGEVDYPTFELQVDSYSESDSNSDLGDFLKESNTLSTQEVNSYMNSFCESDIAKEIEKVRKIKFIYFK